MDDTQALIKLLRNVVAFGKRLQPTGGSTLAVFNRLLKLLATSVGISKRWSPSMQAIKRHCGKLAVWEADLEPYGVPVLLFRQSVIVVAFRNRNLILPEDYDELYEIQDKELASLDEQSILHTRQFRFLDRAAILEQGSTPQPWRECTVTQVGEVEILTKMMPIIASTIIMNTSLAQLQTFSVQQGNIMDLHLGSIKVEAPSILSSRLCYIHTF